MTATVLTGRSVFVDPVHELLSRHVLILAGNVPLMLHVGPALDGHQTNDHREQRVVTSYVTDPAKQLSTDTTRNDGAVMSELLS